MSVETIEAISGLWPIIVSATLLAIAFIFRDPIKGVLGNFTQLEVERGDTKVSMSQEPEEAELEKQSKVQEIDESELEESVSEKVSEQLEPGTSGEWISEMAHAFFRGDSERGEESYKRAQESERDAEQRVKNEAFYLFLSYKSGETSALGKLRELAEQTNSSPETLSNVRNWIGMSYELASDPAKAAEAYQLASEAAPTDERRAALKVSAAQCLSAAGDREMAYSGLTNEINKSNAHGALSILYKGLASQYEVAGDSELRAIALEKAIQYNPSDTRALFDAGYSFSENDFDALSLLHYNTILKFKSNHGTALNNIAVAYGELQMPVHETEFLKRAVEENNTLAASNLAKQYIDAGFAEEASQVLNRARRQDDAHPNVGRALADIADTKEKESEMEKEYLVAAREQRRFLLSFADAYIIDCENSVGNFDGNWHFSDGVAASLTEENNKLSIEWERGSKKHRIIGHIGNYGAKITKYTRKSEYSTVDLGDRGYAYLDQKGQQIEIMIMKDGTHSFMTLRRVE